MWSLVTTGSVGRGGETLCRERRFYKEIKRDTVLVPVNLGPPALSPPWVLLLSLSSPWVLLLSLSSPWVLLLSLHPALSLSLSRPTARPAALVADPAAGGARDDPRRAGRRREGGGAAGGAGRGGSGGRVWGWWGPGGGACVWLCRCASHRWGVRRNERNTLTARTARGRRASETGGAGSCA